MKMRREGEQEKRVEGRKRGMAGMGEDFRRKRAHAALASSSFVRGRGPFRGYVSTGDLSKVRERSVKGSKRYEQKGKEARRVSGLVIFRSKRILISLVSKTKRMLNYSTQDSRVVPHRGTN